ncbi:MAG: hypothetical protein ACYDE0_06825 [Acidiferrobacterales bacterium]
MIATGIWQAVVSIGSYVPSRYPDIRGEWEGCYVENGKTIIESVRISHQFGKRIQGTFISPSETGERIVYRFSGEFVYHGYFAVRFKPKSRKHTDYGVGLFKVDNAGSNIKGGSVSFNYESGKLEPRDYQIIRKERA